MGEQAAANSALNPGCLLWTAHKEGGGPGGPCRRDAARQGQATGPPWEGCCQLALTWRVAPDRVATALVPLRGQAAVGSMAGITW
jgi:hypothetical protein